MKFSAMLAVAAAATLAFSGAAVAGPQWTYAEVGYYQADSGLTDASNNTGFQLAGSFGFTGIGHVGASYLDAEAETGPASPDFDYDGFSINAGVHPHVTDKTDLVIDLIYVDYEGDVSGLAGDASIDGFGIRTGVRSMISDKFELNVIGSWLTGDIESTIVGFSLREQDFKEISVQLGGQYNFTDLIAVGVVYTINDPLASTISANVSGGCLNCDSLMINFRVNFSDVL